MSANLRSHDRGHSLHVLTITPFFPSAADEANGCFISEPLQWLAKLGIENTVLAVQPFYRAKSDALPSTVAAEWIRYFSLPRGWGLASAGAFLFARLLGKVRELHQKRNFAAIHAHAPLPCGHAAMLLSAELGIPYVVSVHGLDAFSTVQVAGRPGQWCKRISKRVYHNSRRVICISERVREQVLEGMGRNCRTSVVYNGVDPEKFPPSEGTESGSPKVLSVGTLIPIKGQDLLLQAAAALTTQFPTLQWDFIGEGPERQHLLELAARLHVSDRVTFLGRQSRNAVAAAMKRCTIFALPSRYEGLGCVYLEAMSCGKPVIGCREQGIAEVIQHGSNGFLVGPGNERELTIAIEMLLRDSARRANLGRAARDTIQDAFTLEHQAEALARIYRETAQ